MARLLGLHLPQVRDLAAANRKPFPTTSVDFPMNYWEINTP